MENLHVGKIVSDIWNFTVHVPFILSCESPKNTSQWVVCLMEYGGQSKASLYVLDDPNLGLCIRIHIRHDSFSHTFSSMFEAFNRSVIAAERCGH